MKIILLKIDYLMDKYVGWFFTNGRKIGNWEKRVELKRKQLIKLENGKKS